MKRMVKLPSNRINNLNTKDTFNFLKLFLFSVCKTVCVLEEAELQKLSCMNMLFWWRPHICKAFITFLRVWHVQRVIHTLTKSITLRQNKRGKKKKLRVKYQNSLMSEKKLDIRSLAFTVIHPCSGFNL